LILRLKSYYISAHYTKAVDQTQVMLVYIARQSIFYDINK